MDWYRAYHGTISDPKFAVIASRSGQPKVAVLAIWQALLEYASQCDERGSLEGVDFEVIAACLDVTQCNVTSVYDALCDKKLIAKNRIAAWEKRQIVRDDDSKERVRKHREKKRQQGLEADKPDSVTQCNADVTQCNAPEQNRTDKIREEIKKVSYGEGEETGARSSQSPPPSVKTLDTGLDLNDLFICVDVVCLLFGKKRLSPKEQETLAVWCGLYDMRKALALVEAELIKFRAKNNKDPTSVAYFSAVLDGVPGIRLPSKNGGNIREFTKGLATK